MYAYIAAATGWTWEYIGECLTLPRVYAMQKHWATYPPVHIMAALWAGYKPATPETAKTTQEKTAQFVSDQPVMVIKRPGNV